MDIEKKGAKKEVGMTGVFINLLSLLSLGSPLRCVQCVYVGVLFSIGAWNGREKNIYMRTPAHNPYRFLDWLKVKYGTGTREKAALFWLDVRIREKKWILEEYKEEKKSQPSS